MFSASMMFLGLMTTADVLVHMRGVDMQTIIEAVKHIWGRDYIIIEIICIAFLLICFGISELISRKTLGGIYNMVNDIETTLLKNKPINDKRVNRHYKKITIFSDAVIMSALLFVYLFVCIPLYIEQGVDMVVFFIMYTVPVLIGAVIFSGKHVRSYNKYLQRSILIEGTITEVYAGFIENGFQIAADYVFTDPNGKEHKCTQAVIMFMFGFPYGRQFEKWKKLYYPGKKVNILVNAYEYNLSYLPMREDYSKAYKRPKELYLYPVNYRMNRWRENKEDSDIEVDWSGFDMANYPKEDPYTLMFRFLDTRSTHYELKVGKLHLCPMHPTTKLQWAFVIGFYTALSVFAFIMGKYYLFFLFVMILLAYVTIMPLIMRDGEKLHERLCRERYKSDYIRKIKDDHSLSSGQGRIRRYVLSNGLEKQIQSAIGLQTIFNKASKWYLELGYNLGDIILLQSINGKSVCDLETTKARQYGLPEDYYVIAVKDTQWLCCTKEDERIYAFSKSLGLTHTNYSTLYDYIIDVCDIQE